MLAPTLSWDAMKMHLPLSQYYLQVHALEPKPGLDYSFFPQAAESIFALAWSLGGQPAAQLISPMFFALSLLAAWILARDCGADAVRSTDRRCARCFPARPALGRIRAEERCGR